MNSLLLALVPLLAIAQPGVDTPGCTNPHIEDDRFVVECVDHRNYIPFQFVDLNNKYKPSYIRALWAFEAAQHRAGAQPRAQAVITNFASSPAAKDIANEVFRDWVDSGRD